MRSVMLLLKDRCLHRLHKLISNSCELERCEQREDAFNELLSKHFKCYEARELVRVIVFQISPAM